MKNLVKWPILCLKKTELLSAVACRVVQLTGKHPERIHPKHLLRVREPWYLNYLNKNDLVLDLGCNNGQHSLQVAAKVKHLWGIDYDQKMLAIAKREANRKKVQNVSFCSGNLEKKLLFKKNTFNVILFLDVFEHLYGRNQILNEVYRVLKPGGMLLFAVPNSNTRWKQIQKYAGISYYSDPDHKIEFTQKQIVGILEKHKFQVSQVFPVTLDTPLVGFIDLLGSLSLSLYRLVSIWRRNMALRYPKESIGFEIAARK
jgi:2-polyprenyl-3-methyl-5-hydroxy-6-metoxy-1,4-benzoquinol methylase